MTSARQFLRSVIDEDFGSLGQVRHHLDQAEHNEGMARTHQGQAVAAKAQGDRAVSALHANAAEQHSDLSSIHQNLAQAHLKNAQAGHNLHEGFGRGITDPETLYRSADYNMQLRAPVYDSPRPKHTTATVQDLRNVCNHVAARHSARVDLVRDLPGVGFVAALVLQGGAYQGTSTPSISSIAAEMTQELRNVAPAAIVDLLTSDEVPSASGPSARRLIFRFRLSETEKGGF